MENVKIVLIKIVTIVKMVNALVALNFPLKYIVNTKPFQQFNLMTRYA